MPRTSPPAADQAPAEPQLTAPATHRYCAPYTSTYPQIPLTCREGDVWAWPDGQAPADGRWEPTDLPVNTRPDNEPAEPVEEG